MTAALLLHMCTIDATMNIKWWCFFVFFKGNCYLLNPATWTEPPSIFPVHSTSSILYHIFTCQSSHIVTCLILKNDIVNHAFSCFSSRDGTWTFLGCFFLEHVISFLRYDSVTTLCPLRRCSASLANLSETNAVLQCSPLPPQPRWTIHIISLFLSEVNWLNRHPGRPTLV